MKGKLCTWCITPVFDACANEGANEELRTWNEKSAASKDNST